MAKKDKDQKSTGNGGAKAIAEIDKKYGKGAIMTLASDAVVQCEVIPTGDMGIDLALGVGGIPRGRIIEIYGPESSGKTTLSLQVVAQAQKVGGVAAFVDAEHALDPTWARRLGVKIQDLLISQPSCGEEALDIVEILVRGGDLDVIVVDSVAALTPRAELEGEMGDSSIGVQARLMSQAMRKLTGIVQKSHTTVIFINQIREKIGVMFGNPETTPGGKALKFYASIRIDIRKIGVQKAGDVSIGSKTKVKIVKNKLAPPFREAECTIYYGDPVAGFDNTSSLRDMAVKHGIIEKSGSWHNYGAIRLGNGEAAVADFLRDNDNSDLATEIRKKLMEKVGPKKFVATEDEAGFSTDEDEDPELDLPPVKPGLAGPPMLEGSVVDDTSDHDDDDDVDSLIDGAVGV